MAQSYLAVATFRNGFRHFFCFSVADPVVSPLLPALGMVADQIHRGPVCSGQTVGMRRLRGVGSHAGLDPVRHRARRGKLLDLWTACRLRTSCHVRSPRRHADSHLKSPAGRIETKRLANARDPFAYTAHRICVSVRPPFPQEVEPSGEAR